MKTKLITIILSLCVSCVFLSLASCGGGGGSIDDSGLICGDGIKYDADGDGVYDAEDGDEYCDDGNTVDGDDCPADCLAPQADVVVTTETSCTDTLDNDGDGLVDCLDTDCAADAACVVAAEPETLCADGVDNDGDGKTDCVDEDCMPLIECEDDGGADAVTETNCSDGLDDDSDGTVDCADSDCAAYKAGDTDCDGIGNQLDWDQDGDGLCDNRDLCYDSDPSRTIQNQWWVVGHGSSEEKECQSGGEYFFFARWGSSDGSPRQQYLESLSMGTYKNCCDSEGVSYYPGTARGGLCVIGTDSSFHAQ